MNMYMRPTAFHFIDNLSTGQYESEGQRIMELIRNGLRACMPDPKLWEPKRARIEISLAPNHPLNGKGPVLIVLDHGRGMTDPDVDRYFNWIGTPLSKLRSDQNGSIGDSQKGMGRMAAIALCKKCIDQDTPIMERIKHGYYLFSRTSKTGKVRFVPFIPERVEEEGLNIERFIDPAATEMGPLKGIQGSFTAIVVPDPIFDTHTDIYEAVKWFLPREKDKMFELLIGGKVMQPPPLASEVTVTSKDGLYRAYLGVGTKERSGAWLCDNDTAFRVASCQRMSNIIPDPLWYPDLFADIFGPGLIRHQNTSRSTLAREYTRPKNKDWQNFRMFLISQVVPAAKQLMERDIIKGDAADTLDELVGMFHEQFGEPEKPPRTPNPNPTPRPTPGPHPTPPENDPDPDPKRRRYSTIKVRDEVYKLYRGQTLDAYIYAQMSFDDPHIVNVNVRGGYKALPPTKAGRLEQGLIEILNEIGMSKFPSDPKRAMRFANEIRSEFLKKPPQ